MVTLNIVTANRQTGKSETLRIADDRAARMANADVQRLVAHLRSLHIGEQRASQYATTLFEEGFDTPELLLASVHSGHLTQGQLREWNFKQPHILAILGQIKARVVERTAMPVVRVSCGSQRELAVAVPSRSSTFEWLRDEANRQYTRTFGHNGRSIERFSIGGALLDERDELFAAISPSEAIEAEWSVPDTNSQLAQESGWICAVCTYEEADSTRPSCSMCGTDNPAFADPQQPPGLPREQATSQTAPTAAGDNPQTTAWSQQLLETSHPVASALDSTTGWACLVCTFMESDMLRPSCSICGADRPSSLEMAADEGEVSDSNNNQVEQLLNIIDIIDKTEHHEQHTRRDAQNILQFCEFPAAVDVFSGGVQRLWHWKASHVSRNTFDGQIVENPQVCTTALERNNGDIALAKEWITSSVADPLGWLCPCGLRNSLASPVCIACEKRRASDEIKALVALCREPERARSKFVCQSVVEAILEYSKQLDSEDLQLQALREQQDAPVVRNTESFECEIWCDDVPVGEGVVLKNCGHALHIEALKGQLRTQVAGYWSSDSASVEMGEQVNDNEVKGIVTCPICNVPIQETEIRALTDEVSPVESLVVDCYLVQATYTKWEETMKRNLAGRVGCCTADCEGFFCTEDDGDPPRTFRCYLCTNVNCLQCRAQHEDFGSCKAYQDDIRIHAANDVALKASLGFLNGEVQAGRAMVCLGCDIVVVRDGGCNWMKCGGCATELCWQTKKARKAGKWGAGCGGGHNCH